MKASMERAAIFDALAWHGKGAPSPGLVHMSVESPGAPLRIQSSSDAFWRSSYIPVADSEPGVAVFSCARLIEQGRIGKKDDQVVLSTNDAGVRSVIGRSDATTPLIVEDPRFWAPKGAPDLMAEVDSVALAWALKAANACTAPQEEMLRNVRIAFGDGKMQVQGTNKYRMSIIDVPVVTGAQVKRVYNIIAGPYITALQHIKSDLVGISDADGNFMFEDSGGGVIATPPQADGIPDLASFEARADAAINDEPHIVVSRSELLNAMGGVGTGGAGAVTLDFAEGYVAVSNAAATDRIEGRTVAEIDADVPEAMVGTSIDVNVEAIKAPLQGIRTERVVLVHSAPHSSLYLFEEQDEAASAETGLFRGLVVTLKKKRG